MSNAALRQPVEHTVTCWRCQGRGHLGRLPSGAFLIDKLCNGSGQLIRPVPIRSTPLTRLADAFHGWVKRRIVCNEEEL
jgi:hypothetical protein